MQQTLPQVLQYQQGPYMYFYYEIRSPTPLKGCFFDLIPSWWTLCDTMTQLHGQGSCFMLLTLPLATLASDKEFDDDIKVHADVDAEP